MASKAKLSELMWEHRVQAAALVAFVAATAVSISVLGPRLGAVLSFFWPLLVSTGFFLVTVAVLLRFSPPPAGADESGKDLIEASREATACRPFDSLPTLWIVQLLKLRSL